jgi:hypothetical protein
VTTSDPEPSSAPPAAAPATTPAEPPAEPPATDPFRSNVPSEPAEIHRKLLFGGALVCALISVYAGLLGWGRFVQYGFAGLAVLIVFAALISGVAAATPRPGPPTRPGPPEDGG